MPNRFASGKHSIAECDRCGFRYKLKALKTLTIKTKNVNLLVCSSCWEEDHPQLQLGMYPVDDPQAVRDPRPDTSYDSSRDIEWGWNPLLGVQAAVSLGSVLINEPYYVLRETTGYILLENGGRIELE